MNLQESVIETFPSNPKKEIKKIKKIIWIGSKTNLSRSIPNLEFDEGIR